MTICINGSNREIPSGITLDQLIKVFNLKRESIILELNRKVVDRNIYSTAQLKENDILEIVHFVGGG